MMNSGDDEHFYFIESVSVPLKFQSQSIFFEEVESWSPLHFLYILFAATYFRHVLDVEKEVCPAKLDLERLVQFECPSAKYNLCLKKLR